MNLIPFIGPQESDQWCHFCSVVALDWVDLTIVTWNLHSSVMCSILTCLKAVQKSKYLAMEVTFFISYSLSFLYLIPPSTSPAHLSTKVADCNFGCGNHINGNKKKAL